MKGTEKQIAWAEDIIRRAYEGLEKIIADADAEAARLAENAKAMEEGARRDRFMSRVEGFKRRAENARAAKESLDQKLSEEKYQDAGLIINRRDGFKLFSDSVVFDSVSDAGKII